MLRTVSIALRSRELGAQGSVSIKKIEAFEMCGSVSPGFQKYLLE